MSNRGKQRTVREGQFDRTLEEFNREIALKTTLTMAKFHEIYVDPLEARILLLETLTGIRLLRWLRGLPLRIKAWFLLTFTEPIPEPAPEPAPLPEPEHDGRSRILTL